MNTKDSGIGIDPTKIPVIENLDVTPTQKTLKTNKNNNSKETVVKKIVFTLCMILLMFAVAFGVYYYLHLGEENKRNANFQLKSLSFIEGVSLPLDINDYGDFSKVDIKKCTLDISSVDISKPGDYDYSVSCGKNKKISQIIITEFNDFNLNTKIVYKKTSDTLNPKEFFVNTDNKYNFTFLDEESYRNYLISVGLHSIPIKVVNGDKEQIIYGILLVSKDDLKKELSCEKENITDIFYFNVNDYEVTAIRKIKNKFDTVDLLDSELKKSIDGKLTINNHSGYILFDYDDVNLSLVEKLTNNKLYEENNNNFSFNLTDIRNLYEQNLKYQCKLISY